MTKFRNYINLEDKELDTPIYRIISLKRLEELFISKQNVLVSPNKWDDPFENFILKSKIKMDDGVIGEIGFRDSYYGQCWTTHKASDAMWRIYSEKAQGVRIRTTIRKLAKSLSDTQNELKNSSCFIGKVEYLGKQKLLEFANTVLTGMPRPIDFARTLLVKRPAFQHEREVRLIYSDIHKNNKKDIFSYSIDPHELIEQIMIDPRLTIDEAKNVKRNIRLKTAYIGTIKRSLLYAPPEDMVFKFGFT